MASATRGTSNSRSRAASAPARQPTKQIQPGLAPPAVAILPPARRLHPLSRGPLRAPARRTNPTAAIPSIRVAAIRVIPSTPRITRPRRAVIFNPRRRWRRVDVIAVSVIPATAAARCAQQHQGKKSRGREDRFPHVFLLFLPLDTPPMAIVLQPGENLCVRSRYVFLSDAAYLFAGARSESGRPTHAENS